MCGALEGGKKIRLSGYVKDIYILSSYKTYKSIPVFRSIFAIHMVIFEKIITQNFNLWTSFNNLNFLL